MKRFLMSLLTAVGLMLPAVSAVAAARYWTVDIYEPSATTNKTLNIEYKVFSTVATDTFTVELFENGASKGTQAVTNPNGNSGIFTISLPSAGTYSYFVRANNNGDSTVKNSKTVSVQVSNAPEPTVTTVTVNQATPANAAGGAGGGAAAGGAGAGAAGAAQAGGQVAGVTGGQGENGTVTGQAATTEDNANQDVLGAQDSAQRNKNRNNIIAAVVLTGASLAGYAYYRLRVAPTE